MRLCTSDRVVYFDEFLFIHSSSSSASLVEGNGDGDDGEFPGWTLFSTSFFLIIISIIGLRTRKNRKKE